MSGSRLGELLTQGQSVWLDFISRDLLRSGELERLIAEDGLRGMTQQPVDLREGRRRQQRVRRRDRRCWPPKA